MGRLSYDCNSALLRSVFKKLLKRGYDFQLECNLSQESYMYIKANIRVILKSILSIVFQDYIGKCIFFTIDLQIMIFRYLGKKSIFVSFYGRTCFLHPQKIVYMNSSGKNSQDEKVNIPEKMTIQTETNAQNTGGIRIDEKQKENEQDTPGGIKEERDQNYNLNTMDWKVIIFSFIACGATVIGTVCFLQHARRNEEPQGIDMNLMKKFGDQETFVRKNHFPNNQTENSSDESSKKRCPNSGSQQVSIFPLLGFPGSGRSVSIRKLVQQMRSQGKRVFYINMRPDPEEKRWSHNLQLKPLRKLPQLFELIVAVNWQHSNNPKRKRILIIDDIHILQQPYLDKLIVGKIQQQLINAIQKNMSIFLISGSDIYTQNVKVSHLAKYSSFGVIQPKSATDMKNAIQSIMNHYGKSKDQFAETIEYLIEKGHSLKIVDEVANSFKIAQESSGKLSTDKQMKASIQKDDRMRKKLYSFKTRIGLSRNKFESGEIHDVKLLKQILNLPQKIDQKDCFRVKTNMQKQKIEDDYHNDYLIKVLQKLSQYEILTYCHPTSAFIKYTFNDLIRKMEITIQKAENKNQHINVTL